jgi:hypothetical protein
MAGARQETGMRTAHLKRLGLAAALAGGLGILPGLAAAEHGHGGAYVRVDGGRHHGYHHHGYHHHGHWHGHDYGHRRGHRAHGGWDRHYLPRHYHDHRYYAHGYKPRHWHRKHHRHHRHCGHAGYGGDHAASLGLLLGYTLLYGDD